MKKRILSILLATVMIVSLLPLYVFATGEASNWSLLGQAMSGESLATATDAFEVSEDTPEAGTRTIKLLNNIKATGSDDVLKVPSDKKIVLDLNGCVLDRGLISSDGKVTKKQYGSVIEVDGVLTINDSSPNIEHKFKISENNDTKGLWILDEENGNKIVKGGVITGGTGQLQSSKTVYYGGGVNVSADAKFTMTAGNISGNAVIGKDGTYNSHGGGVNVSKSAEFTMTAGNLSGNVGTWGGGLYVSEGASFVMTDGCIVNNVAPEYGGGLFVEEKSYPLLGGTAVIRGNNAGNLNESNIHLQNSKKDILKVSSDTPLATGTDIGVTVYISTTNGWQPGVEVGSYLGGTMTDENYKYFIMTNSGSVNKGNVYKITKYGDDYVLAGEFTVTDYTDKSGHGTVKAQKGTYVNGETVYLTVTPAEGYPLKENSLKVYKTGNQNTTVTLVENKDGNYSFTMPAYNVSITATFAKPIGITWDKTEFTYNGQTQQPIASATDLAEGDSFNPNYIVSKDSKDVTEYKNAGTYSVYADFRNDNYEITDGNNQKFTIAPATLTITGATAASKTYDGTTDATITNVTLDGLVNGETLTKDVDYTISGVYDSAEVGTNRTITVTVTLLETEKANNYKMSGTYQLTGQTINKKPAAPVYDYEDPTVTVPVTGGENSVQVSATIIGNTATINQIKTSDLEKVTEGESIIIDFSGVGQNIDTARIPTKTVEKIAEKSSMTVKLPVAIVEFDADATKEIAGQAKGYNIELVVDDIKEVSLNAVQKEAVEKLDTAIIIDAYLASNGSKLCTEADGGFGGGNAKVILPYEIKDNKSAANYNVFYVTDEGKLEKLNAVYDEELKAFVFEIEHFSIYALAYDENGNYDTCPKDNTCILDKYTDTENDAWYHDGVHYCVENGLMKGIADNLFNPNGETSRGMIVTILYRLEGEPAIMNDNIFDDVAEGSWYEKAVIWAQGKGIIGGYGNGKFGPEDPITREQLATILYRYAQYKGQGFTGFWMFLLDYADSADISSWADEAMHWCVMKGVIAGKDGKVLDPLGNASRAEAATMIQRFCEALEK